MDFNHFLTSYMPDKSIGSKIHFENMIEESKFAEEFGVSLINIDDNFISENLNDLIKFDYKKYQSYVSKFLTSRKDEKPNHTIISEILGNL